VLSVFETRTLRCTFAAGISRLAGFVPQFDLLHESLTVSLTAMACSRFCVMPCQQGCAPLICCTRALMVSLTAMACSPHCKLLELRACHVSGAVPEFDLLHDSLMGRLATWLHYVCIRLHIST
jgi:hypothetical protein